LRIALSDLQMKVIYEDMPETIDILTMCEDVFHVRQDGEYALERQLYNELIELYRSPERLIAVTKKKSETNDGAAST
jgi:piezo-type mechanosensitive ion channel component 1/2